MTDEQKKARKLSAESGNIHWIKENCLRTKDNDEDYVFISYKSDDFERVLDDIIYNTCKKYGLRVYFDTAFDENSDSWITQYYENMCDPHCKAFIAFIDNAYYSSYACLLEMMSRKTAAAGGDFKEDSLFFLPINIGSITEIIDSSNTGLGTRRYSNGKLNNHAKEELERFNEIFSEVADADEYMRKSIYKREKDFQLYEEATADSPQYGKVYLTVTQCRRLMERVIPAKNDNDGGNKSFVDVIHDKLINAQINTVFGNIVEQTVAVRNHDVETGFTIEDGSLSSGQNHSVKSVEGYEYTIFGKEYTAKSGEQGKLMYDAFEALIARYPDCVEKMTQRTSVAKAEDVKKANTNDSYPTYFRGCKSFKVGNQEYLVGTSYGFKAKLAEIRGMFKICGANPSEFILNGETLAENKDGDSTAKSIEDNYTYTIFGKEHTAKSGEQGKLMYDAFEALIARYPDCVEKMTQQTSIAKAEDVKNANTNEAYPTYFRACKSFKVGNQEYLVGISYGFDAKMAEIKKMFKICGADYGQFVIISAPEKTTRNTNGKRE